MGVFLCEGRLFQKMCYIQYAYRTLHTVISSLIFRYFRYGLKTNTDGHVKFMVRGRGFFFPKNVIIRSIEMIEYFKQLTRI